MNHITRHILGLFQGLPGARHFRRQLSSALHGSDDPLGLFDELVESMQARLAPRDCPA